MPSKVNILLFFILLSAGVNAQILNDSVQNIYGPATTLYLFEENIKYNKSELQPIDTLLEGFHQFTLTDRLQRKYQDLGNPGTPTRPVYFAPPAIIGQTSGFQTLDPYFISPDKIRYFDTKSPHSKLFFVVGGNGRTVVDVDYSRNINPNWNVGGSFQRISADKQMALTRRGDKHSEITSYQFFTRYFTKDERYQLLANFSRMGSSLAEQGGAQFPPSGNLPDIFENPQPWLNDAFSREVRHNLHLYHQYKVSDLVQVYHSYDRTKQDVSFSIPTLSQNIPYFTHFNIVNDTVFTEEEPRLFYRDASSTNDQSDFLFSKNEIGVKGDINSLFYNFYYKRRDVRYNNIYLPSRNFAENYAGFNLRNDFAKGMHFTAFGEYLLGRNYRLGSSFDFKFLEAKVERVRYDPTLIHEAYESNHIRWQRNFDPTLSDNFYAAATLDLPFLHLKPHLTLQRVSRYIYYGSIPGVENEVPGSNRTPEQAGGAARIFSPGVDLNLRFFKNFYFENQLIYTGISGDAAEIFRIPRLFINSKLYYANFFFENKLQIQVGLDMHYRSSYYAYGYEPTIQQFFLQNDLEIPAYPLADLFLNIKISRARVFLKYTNITQATGIIEGYLSTPYYIGQPGAFDFGISWLFFD